jgi:hypothetical protein
MALAGTRRSFRFHGARRSYMFPWHWGFGTLEGGHFQLEGVDFCISVALVLRKFAKKTRFP